MPQLPQHLFIASDGCLHDCRHAAWAANPLRRDYARHFVNIKTVAQFKSTLRAGPYAWPGGYPLFFIMDHGGDLCFACARKHAKQIMSAVDLHYSDGWRVICCDVNWEEPELTCESCGELIGSAY
ncbi:MAG TPA: hypothetical protein VF748_14610 [Candidatus Acidoferrum sp.]